MAFTGANLSEVKNLITKVKSDGINLSKDLEYLIQNFIIDKVKVCWYAEEGVKYFKIFKEQVDASSCEIAVKINDVIKQIVLAYDTWLRETKGSANEEEASIANSMYYIYFEPDLTYKTTDSGYPYKYTTGGDSREYSYLSSTDTKFNLNIDEIYAVSQDGTESIGIDEAGLNDVITYINTIKESIKEKIYNYQSNLDSSAALMDNESRQSQAVSNFYKSVMSGIDAMFENITSTENKDSLINKLNEVIERYNSDLSNEVVNEIEERNIS